MKAYVLATTRVGTSERVAEAIMKVKNVISAEAVYGRFDVIIVANSEEMETIDGIIHAIQGNPDVLHTETFLTHFKAKSEGITE
jgi:DNA-binding Lrp family transcriptional regulator